MSDPDRVIGGRERGPGEGTVILAGVIVASGIVLLIVRVATSALEPLGVVSNVLLVILGCALGWPALKRVRRDKRRQADS